MNNLGKNTQEHPIITIRKIVKVIKDFVIALKTPIDSSEYIWKYGKVILNTNTGLLSYEDKSIQLRQSDRIYKITRLLVGAMGNEITYGKIAKELDIPYGTKNEQNQARSDIRVSVRDLRRRLGINLRVRKDKNLFITTGKGIKLAYQAK